MTIVQIRNLKVRGDLAALRALRTVVREQHERLRAIHMMPRTRRPAGSRALRRAAERTLVAVEKRQARASC